jgi:predicted metallopeptidase
MKIFILGQPWKVKVINGELFNKTYGSELAGVTDLTAREIVIHASDFNVEVIVHELVHAYYAGMCVGSASLRAHQVEECFCDLFAKYHKEILYNAHEIIKALEDKAD